MRARGWAAFGAAIGLALGVIAFAPAAWLAEGVASATDQRVLLAQPQGTVWRGNATLVLTGGPNSRDAFTLPGRFSWRLGWKGGELRLRAALPCCLVEGFELRATPAIGQMSWRVVPVDGLLAQWPVAWLAGLGAPWNTLQLSGTVRLSSRNLALESAQGRQAVRGQAELQIDGLSSPLSTLPQLGSYRLVLDGSAGDSAALQLSTLQGPLLLQGSGQWGGVASAGALRFRGEASAAPGSESSLNNLLNFIGRRQGAVSILSIG